jgi:hypothetical protein
MNVAIGAAKLTVTGEYWSGWKGVAKLFMSGINDHVNEFLAT